MEKTRLESFSDGVIAIIITIMVLRLGTPQNSDISALYPLIPVFLGYVLSYLYVGLYWNNHHHLLKTAKNITGKILWTNLIFLFWLSLFPFTTAWMAENHFAPWPTILYGVVLLMAAISYFILEQQIVRTEGEKSILKQALGKNHKEKLSLICYVIAIFFALIIPHIAQMMYVIVAILWLIPDKRIERILE